MASAMMTAYKFIYNFDALQIRPDGNGQAAPELVVHQHRQQHTSWNIFCRVAGIKLPTRHGWTNIKYLYKGKKLKGKKYAKIHANVIGQATP
jgi:hypothetical protein